MIFSRTETDDQASSIDGLIHWSVGNPICYPNAHPSSWTCENTHEKVANNWNFYFNNFCTKTVKMGFGLLSGCEWVMIKITQKESLASPLFYSMRFSGCHLNLCGYAHIYYRGGVSGLDKAHSANVWDVFHQSANNVQYPDTGGQNISNSQKDAHPFVSAPPKPL